ncbi:Translation initiation factor IF-3, mitochondrial [Collichthys lucidus]|uniref:Translation initiation factor IF-3, mitochondrial n=1 Tax=Collichthys lucidus TaxID=240159 RepID=A0A4U5UNL2_COLLU|nr:Translation initiation factor IF-3, mitochondrial [Collichthys lucidus]
MSAGCVRWLLSRTVRAACGGWTSSSRFTVCSERANIMASSWRWSPFSTAESDTEATPQKKKKQDPRAHPTISTVGRKIPHRQIQVISDTGENLGVMHRARVIQIMDKEGLKLVVLSEHQDPPVYKLMSGKQVHEEQLKLREKLKDRPPPVQVKELTFTTGIAAHDLTTKLKQVESWLEKKHHIRMTLKSGRGQTAANLDTTLEEIVQQMGVMVGFVSKPKVVRDGRAAMCVLRPPSAKELSQKGKKETAASQTDDAGSKGTPSKAVSNTDTTEETLQQ